MPAEIVAFQVRPARQEVIDEYDGDPYNSDWGRPEVVICLDGDRWNRRDGEPYEYLYMNHRLATSLHRALGDYLAKKAHSAR